MCKQKADPGGHERGNRLSYFGLTNEIFLCRLTRRLQICRMERKQQLQVDTDLLNGK
jgi:hypothetical protein